MFELNDFRRIVSTLGSGVKHAEGRLKGMAVGGTFDSSA